MYPKNLKYSLDQWRSEGGGWSPRAWGGAKMVFLEAPNMKR